MPLPDEIETFWVKLPLRKALLFSVWVENLDLENWGRFRRRLRLLEGGALYISIMLLSWALALRYLRASLTALDLARCTFSMTRWTISCW